MAEKIEDIHVLVGRLDERLKAQDDKMAYDRAYSVETRSIAEEARATATQTATAMEGIPMTIRESIREELKGRGMTIREWMIALAAVAAIVSPFIANAL